MYAAKTPYAASTRRMQSEVNREGFNTRLSLSRMNDFRGASSSGSSVGEGSC